MNPPVLSLSLKLFKALGDETRLRLLLVLRQHELSVTELTRILGVHQSNVSRHLNHLREASLVTDRKEGTLSWYRWSRELRSDKDLAELLERSFAELEDRVSIQALADSVVEERKLAGKNFFEQVAGRYRDMARPGGGPEALLQASVSLLQLGVVADLGCGEGDLSLLFAPQASKVWSIDLSAAMARVVENRAAELGYDHVETKIGDIEALPLESASVDLAILSQSLHHAAEPSKALLEVARILRPGGRLMLLDLVAHEQEWTRESLGDVWLGFQAEDLTTWIENAGMQITFHTQIHPEQGLPVWALTAIKNP